MPTCSRRRFFATAAGCAALTLRAAEPPPLPAFPVGVCDWMILKRQKLGAFKRAREIGADGVEVDMGGLGDRPTFDNKLADQVVRDQFLAEADSLGLRICSIAMSGFYAQSFAERDGIERVVQDAIDTTVAMGAKTIFLPLGVRSDLAAHPELRPAVMGRNLPDPRQQSRRRLARKRSGDRPAGREEDAHQPRLAGLARGGAIARRRRWPQRPRQLRCQRPHAQAGVSQRLSR